MPDEKKLELNEEQTVSDPAQIAAEMLAKGEIPDDMKDIEEAMGLEMGDKTTDVKPPGDGQVGRLTEQEEAAKSEKTDDKGEVKSEEDLAAEAKVAEDKAAEEKAAADKEAADAAKAKEDSSAPLKDEDTFVETVDGKGRIPYSTLKESRAKVTELREKTETLEQKLEESTAARNVLTRRLDEPGASTEERAAKLLDGVELLSDEDIASLREEFPEAIVNSLEKMNATNRSLVKQLGGMQTATADEEAGRQDAIRDEVQSTIDANPVLSKWQQDGDPLWSAAIALDDALVESGKWRGKPLTERYNEVCKQLGHEVPAVAGEDKGDKDDKGGKDDSEKDKGISLTEEVAKKLKEAEDKAAPISHSDLPAGEAPAQSEQEATASMTAMQLEKKFESMSTSQIAEYLSRVA